MKNKKQLPKKAYSENNSSEFDYIQPIEAKPLEVKVYNNFEKAVKAFRALVQKERILSIYKEKQYYEKPSDKKRRKRNEMKRKLLELNSEKKQSPDSEKKKREKKKTESTTDNNG